MNDSWFVQVGKIAVSCAGARMTSTQRGRADLTPPAPRFPVGYGRSVQAAHPTRQDCRIGAMSATPAPRRWSRSNPQHRRVDRCGCRCRKLPTEAGYVVSGVRTRVWPRVFSCSSARKRSLCLTLRRVLIRRLEEIAQLGAQLLVVLVVVH
jgi:hypothetical protein